MALMAPGGLEEQAAYFEMQGMANMREFFISGQELTHDNMKKVLNHTDAGSGWLKRHCGRRVAGNRVYRAVF